MMRWISLNQIVELYQKLSKINQRSKSYLIILTFYFKRKNTRSLSQAPQSVLVTLQVDEGFHNPHSYSFLCKTPDTSAFNPSWKICNGMLVGLAYLGLLYLWFC